VEGGESILATGSAVKLQKNGVLAGPHSFVATLLASAASAAGPSRARGGRFLHRSAPDERHGLAVPVAETDCRVPPPRRNGGVGAACAPRAVEGSAGGVEPLRMRKRWQRWRRPVDLQGWPSAQLPTWRPYSLLTLH